MDPGTDSALTSHLAMDPGDSALTSHLAMDPGTDSALTSHLLQAWPDLGQVARLVGQVSAGQREARERDATRTPLPLLLGVLARYQLLQEEQGERGPEEVGGEGTEELEATLKYYWEHIHTVGLGLRAGVATAAREELEEVLERNRREVATQLGLEQQDLLVFWVSECGPEDGGVEGHCPDLVLSRDRARGCLVLTLLGTRVTPAPCIQDILMDLRADSAPFLGGQAHAGMVEGTANILGLVLARLVEELASLPSLLVVGYSLGAGLAQLVTARLLHGEEAALLPPGTRVRCLAYGAPPVYRGEEVLGLPEVTVVQNSRDGIICSSVGTVGDLLSKAVALDAAEIDRSTMVAMLLRGGGGEGEDVDDKAEDESEGVVWNMQGFFRRIKSKVEEHISRLTVPEEAWERVGEALEQRQEEASLPWTLLTGRVVQLTARQEGGVALVLHSTPEAVAELSRELRLHPSMYGDHMPWGYAGLFQGVQERPFSLDCLDTL